MPYQRLSQKTPKFFALAIEYSQLEHYACQGSKAVKNVVVLRFGKLLRGSAHRIERPLIVFARTVNGAHDCLIALNQYRGIHSGLEVECANGIVSRSFTKQTSFALQAPPQLGFG